MVSRNFGKEDLELLGYNTPLEVTPETATNWTLYKATAIAGLENIETFFLYLKSNCVLEDVRRAADVCASKKTLYVIKPRSLRLSDQSLSKKLGNSVPIYVHEELLWERIHSVFKPYIESLEGTPSEKYYVKPESGDKAIGNGLSDMLLQYLTGQEKNDSGKMAVVCANAGIGKTTLARYLVQQLRKGINKYRTIPVFVEAQHWGKLQLDSLDTLWEVIENSLHTSIQSFRLTEDLFRHALKQGYLCFVFDGFDELCGRKVSNFVPSDILADLSEIALESNARILITTRSLYWKAEVPEPPSNTIVYEVEGFNTQQAKGYFQKYFSNDTESRGLAIGVYKKLIKNAYKPRDKGGARTQFVNLPLCVAMVAEYVRNGGKDLDARNSRELVEKLLLNICQREVERKQLKTKSREQLQALKEISVMDSGRTNPEFELELLEAAGVDESDIRKMIDHPMLDRIDDERFRFSYDFLAPYLRALYVAESLERHPQELTSSVHTLMRQEGNGKGFMLEHLYTFLNEDALSLVGKAYINTGSGEFDVKSFLFHLAQGLVEKEKNIITSEERTGFLFKTLNPSFQQNKTVRGLSISGTVERLDLRGITFKGCKFVDVIFRNCKADMDTSFHHCIFSGELTIDSTGSEKASWAEIVLDKCDVAFPASVVLEDLLKSGGVAWEEQVLDALRVALGKFWYHGRPKQSIKCTYWNRGILRHSGLGEPLLETMLRFGLLERIHVSGVSEGGLALDKSSLVDLQRFMDNQQLGGRIKKVYNGLIERGKI